jgi:hypothetical protein
MVVFLDDIRLEDAPPPAPPASGKNLPKFTREKIETWRTDHDIQAFSGILKDAGLPPDITMDDDAVAVGGGGPWSAGILAGRAPQYGRTYGTAESGRAGR